MYSMTRRTFALAAALLVATAMAACSESATPQATGKGNIRGLNAIVTAPEIGFLIEERNLGNVNYKGVTSFNIFDDLTYNFNFDLLIPGQADANRLATEFVDVLADHEYTVVLTGSIADPSSLYWEDPIREWAESDTVSEVFFAHLAPQIGELDVYFAAAGTVPVLGQSVGSIAFGERLPAQDFEAGVYELILTLKDDPASIRYQSVQLTAVEQTRAILAVFDPDPTLPGNLGVNILGGPAGSSVVADVNFPPQMRTFHAALGTQNYDGYLDSDFSNLVFSDIGFLELSQYADVLTSIPLLTLTQVGNSGATIHEGDIAVSRGTRNTLVLAGEPGGLVYVGLLDRARPLETYPQIRFLNASFNTDALDIYMLEPGTSPDDAILPLFGGLPTLLNTGFGPAPEGMREITATLQGEKTPVSSPVLVDLAAGNSADIIIVDTVDPAVVELVVFDLQ